MKLSMHAKFIWLAVGLIGLAIVANQFIWKDRVIVPYGNTNGSVSHPVELPTGCTIESKPYVDGSIVIAHCPFWVNYPN